ncbi:hypothetical protein [Ruegeria sp. MALMAid1280]|uniref:hypothetical protein n=1 Tax=Ruegeria sp. MALMAid1280 TaxID=3411634 RepID=UPI003B9E90AF
MTEYRIPYIFVEALNEGTLFERSSRIFEEAARSGHLYDVVVGKDKQIICTGMLQDTLTGADGQHREEELCGLMVHPAARGIGVVGLMIKLMLVHCHAILRDNSTVEDYIAHGVDGNRGPIHALLATGIEDMGAMKLHPGEFDGHIEHMMAPGEDYVPMRAYRFDRNALDGLICELRGFWHGSRELSRVGSNMRLKVDFSDMVAPEFLNEEYERISSKWTGNRRKLAPIADVERDRPFPGAINQEF